MTVEEAVAAAEAAGYRTVSGVEFDASKRVGISIQIGDRSYAKLFSQETESPEDVFAWAGGLAWRVAA